MKVGVSGTREGANDKQLAAITAMINRIGPGHELHHGDCKGVDEQVAKIARDAGWRIVCHPPESDYLRAFFPSDEVRVPAGYLKRDRAIVDETEFLIVVPLQDSWQPKGGTWYTHDYAVKTNKPLEIFYPTRE